MHFRRTKNPMTRRRRTNQALLILVPLAVLTGLFSNTIGVDWLLDPAAMHGVVALAIVVVTPWKAPIVRRGLGRKRPGRWTSIVLLVTIAITVASGLVHSAALADSAGPMTIMQLHIGSAVIALGLVFFHYRHHPVPIRSRDLDRRAFLGSIGLGAGALASLMIWQRVLSLSGSVGADRRFTGSHERASFDPTAMPVTSWLDDRIQHLDAGEWRLRVDGSDHSLADLALLPNDDVTAVLDCTSAWYSEQVWTGVRLDRLVSTDKRSIAVRSMTGYGRRFPTRDLDRLWLVTAVGGEPLFAGHGFPARIVSPDRRGFWWVKWVVSIEPSDIPWWLQLPFPVT